MIHHVADAEWKALQEVVDAATEAIERSKLADVGAFKEAMATLELKLHELDVVEARE